MIEKILYPVDFSASCIAMAPYVKRAAIELGAKVSLVHVVGPVKKALLQAARQSDADVLMIGRSPQPGAYGRILDLTYAMIRDSPFPVLRV
ncbi:MAG: universal stress protein [Acidobacteriaceae bacterium]